MESSYASGHTVPGINEDSVDIYDGLEVGISSNPENSPCISPYLKESMDLYEDIVTEEQQSRESSYIELMSRFQTAQNQIKELHGRLEQMEMQNTGLSNENNCLKKNISALLRTARQEVMRKDAEIQRLNQWAERSRHSHQTRVNNVQDPSFSSQASTTESITSVHKEVHPSKHPHQSSRKEGHSCTGSSKVSPHSDSKRDVEVVDRRTKSEKYKSKNGEEKYHGQKLSESTDKRHRGCSDPNKNLHASVKNRSQRADKVEEQRYDSMSCKGKNYLTVDGPHRLDASKISSLEMLHSSASSDNNKGNSREQKPDKSKMVTSDYDSGTAHHLKEGHSREHRKIRSSHAHDRHSSSKDKKKSSPSQHTHCHPDFQKDREGDRQKDTQRRGDKGRESDLDKKHKRRSGSERERERWRPKKSDKVKADARSEEKQKRTCKAVKISSEKPNLDGKNFISESSPNRKLCFMETLNLTLSPNKKPAVSIDVAHDNLTPVDKDAGNKPDMDNSQLNIEDMCVIDEADNSELEEGTGDVLEQSPDHLNSPSPERIRKRDAGVVDVQEKDKSSSETADQSFQFSAVLAHSKPTDIEQNEMTVDLTPKSPESSSLKVMDSSEHNEDKTTLLPKKQETECGTLEVTKGTDLSDISESISEHHTNTELPKPSPVDDGDLSAADTKCAVLDLDGSLKTVTLDSNEGAADSTHSKETDVNEDVGEEASPKRHQIPPSVAPHSSQQQLCPPSSTNFTLENDCCGEQDFPKDTDPVSSTISLDLLPQEGLSLTEAIYVLTETNVDVSDSSVNVTEPSSSVGCIGVSKVSSTTGEKMVPENNSVLTATPKKSFSPGQSQESNIEPSSSVPFLHDEDSMMHTLSNLRKIPDAISPLRSPVRKCKRSLIHVESKPGYIKSLQKDFSTSPVNGSSKKLDVNKENKYPGCAASHDNENLADKVFNLPSSLSDTDLEEGEILSESDEAASSSPVPATKRTKLVKPVRQKPSSVSVLKGKSEERRAASKGTREAPGISTQSPKSRFKTVCPAASKASFSNIEEIMETFKLVRAEIRKKFMKLHKTFPKKSFYGMMDNFQKSFLEFVDGAHFGQICNQVEELKAKLKKLIGSVFSKVLNNGIVKRIFEQQAVDLKQKLWDFVDVQVDYLFKDIHTSLKSHCKPTRTRGEDKKTCGDDKESQQPPPKKPQHKQKDLQSPPSGLNGVKQGAMVPYKTGLGSRGKDIRITHTEKDRNVHSHPPNQQNVVESLPHKNLPSTPERRITSALVVSQSGSAFDRTDFELLTEQQASSLTFNLVRDSQMGEIFKCLLQGSDLLENSGATSDNPAWPLGTPRKDGERFISITTPSKYDSPSKLLSPAKFDSPSKLVAAWSSISPRKMLSPRPKEKISLNPAMFDESCLLEVPSENRLVLQTGLAQKSYSILAEDLAVSLTIPSPLKSDSHLSFLQSSSTSMQIMSTPESVISAHISEDALLDGEDATEQDIHLTLDTDNSSCGSRSSVASEMSITPFVFKPDMPMQALVMEKSNDHFIVKIRQARMNANITLTADKSLSQTLIEDEQHHMDGKVRVEENRAVFMETSQRESPSCCAKPSEKSFSKHAEDLEMCQIDIESDTHHTSPDSRDTSQQSRGSQARASEWETEEINISESERSLTIAEDMTRSLEKVQDWDKSKKRKKHQEKVKAKRPRKKDVQSVGETSPSKGDEEESGSSPAALSPSSLSAKNVVRKKGEVVVTWTRDDDRAILIDLKTKGPSRETFTALSEKLDKPSGQIAHRFYQLMKLFKKQEKKEA
ncbi:CASP8-associated protein 2 [Xenentodon cancila]